MQQQQQKKKKSQHSASSFLTFVRHLESQGAAGVVRFEVEPHLVTGAHHKVRCGCARQAAKRGEKRETSFLKCTRTTV